MKFFEITLVKYLDILSLLAAHTHTQKEAFMLCNRKNKWLSNHQMEDSSVRDSPEFRSSVTQFAYSVLNNGL